MHTLSKNWFYLLLVMAMAVTLWYGLKIGLIGLAVFALLPYTLAVYLIYIAKHISSIITAQVVSVFILCVGIYFLLDTTYMERNLAYKFSFLFMPIWQLTMLLVSGFVIFLGNGRGDEISPQTKDAPH